MNTIGAVKPGVSTRTLAKKRGVTTKGEADAQDAAEKQNAVITQISGGGRTLVTKAEAERRRLIDAAKADLAAQEQIVDPIPADQKTPMKAQPGQKKSTASARVKASTTPAEPKDATSDAELTVALAAKDAAQTAEPVKVKASYNPAPLSGAPAAGKAPAKGQLPLGLLRMLVKRNPNSETLKAALAAAESGATAPVKKAKKAKK